MFIHHYRVIKVKKKKTYNYNKITYIKNNHHNFHALNFAVTQRLI